MWSLRFAGVPAWPYVSRWQISRRLAAPRRVAEAGACAEQMVQPPSADGRGKGRAPSDGIGRGACQAPAARRREMEGYCPGRAVSPADPSADAPPCRGARASRSGRRVAGSAWAAGTPRGPAPRGVAVSVLRGSRRLPGEARCRRVKRCVYRSRQSARDRASCPSCSPFPSPAGRWPAGARWRTARPPGAAGHRTHWHRHRPGLRWCPRLCVRGATPADRGLTVAVPWRLGR